MRHTRGTYAVHTRCTCRTRTGRACYILGTCTLHSRGKRAEHTRYTRGTYAAHALNTRGTRAVHTRYTRGTQKLRTRYKRGTYAHGRSHTEPCTTTRRGACEFAPLLRQSSVRVSAWVSSCFSQRYVFALEARRSPTVVYSSLVTTLRLQRK